MPPQRRYQQTLEVLLALLLAPAMRRPLLLVVEDLHWADPSTLDLLGLLVDQGPTPRVLTLLTCRPEFSPPWAGGAPVSRLTLAWLDSRQTALMIERVAGGERLPPDMLRDVLAKTDGAPSLWRS